jgi:hypothetical protein
MLFGCTNAVMRPLVVDPDPNVDIPPVFDFIGDASTVRIFMVHGMTRHPENWSVDPIAKIAGRLKLSPVAIAIPPVDIYLPEPEYSDRYAGRLDVKVFSDGKGKTYRFYALWWSPVTDPWKCVRPIRSDRDASYTGMKDPPTKDGNQVCGKLAESGFPERRAAVNGYVKNLVLDDGFVDAVLYVGEYGLLMREVVAEALCKALADQLDNTHKLCDSKSIKFDKKTEQLVFVTHSLGSMMLLDTLNDVVNQKGLKELGASEAETGKAVGAALREALDRQTPFYMFANQIALLQLAAKNKFIHMPGTSDAAGEEPERELDLHPFFRNFLPGNPIAAQLHGDEMQNILTRHPEISLFVIGVSDPNDDLSFLIKRPYGAPHQEKTNIHNVFVKNAWELVFALEGPGTAHTGYFENADVHNLMACGTSGSGLKTCD